MSLLEILPFCLSYILCSRLYFYFNSRNIYIRALETGRIANLWRAFQACFAASTNEFNDNVRILCLYCNVKTVGKLDRFGQKGEKQASFLAFHKCCQGCPLRVPCYISTSFILVCTQRQGTRKVYSQAEKFIRIVRKMYSSSTNKGKMYSHSIFVQQMY